MAKTDTRHRESLPQEIDAQSRYYECKGCIQVVAEFRDSEGKYLGTKIVNIPAYRLKRSLARMDKRKSTPRRWRASHSTTFESY